MIQIDREPSTQKEAPRQMECHPNPCPTCPYRKDTPLGIWDRSEYEKLPAWDHPMAFAGIFLCHTDSSALCRGWVEVHSDNMAVRMATFRVKWDENNRKPTKVPLYRSGREAKRAGLRGVPRPSLAACRAMAKIKARRASRPEAADSVVKPNAANPPRSNSKSLCGSAIKGKTI